MALTLRRRKPPVSLESHLPAVSILAASSPCRQLPSAEVHGPQAAPVAARMTAQKEQGLSLALSAQPCWCTQPCRNSDQLHLELAEVWHGGRGLGHAAEGAAGLGGWHSAVADGGAELLQCHQHLLLQPLLLLLLPFQAALPLQHRLQGLAQLLHLHLYSIQLLCNARAAGSTGGHWSAPSKAVMSWTHGVWQGSLSAGIFDLE